MDDKKLLEQLINIGLLTREQSDKILSDANLVHKKAEELIYDRNLVSEIDIALAKSKILGIPYKKVNNSCLVFLEPGKIPKEKAAEEISKVIGFKSQEIIEALPTGGFRIET